jgi:hypothetical protein
VRERWHCGFTEAEWEEGLEDLVAWVEDGDKPKGEDFLADDLTTLGGTYTLTPRYGLPEADEIDGAHERVTLSGTITLNGQPVESGYVYPVIVKGTLEQLHCTFFEARSKQGGRYETVVVGEGEVPGCGAPDTDIYLGVYDPNTDKNYTSDRTIAWPTDADELTFNVTLTDELIGRKGGNIYGSVVNAEGKALPPRTLIEAYSGEKLCGVSATAEAMMAYADPTGYVMWVTGEGCAEDAPLTFRIDGGTAEQTATNRYGDYQEVNLTLP